MRRVGERPPGVTRSDSFSTPLRPPCRICGWPPLISAASRRSNSWSTRDGDIRGSRQGSRHLAVIAGARANFALLLRPVRTMALRRACAVAAAAQAVRASGSRAQSVAARRSGGSPARGRRESLPCHRGPAAAPRSLRFPANLRARARSARSGRLDTRRGIRTERTQQEPAIVHLMLDDLPGTVRRALEHRTADEMRHELQRPRAVGHDAKDALGGRIDFDRGADAAAIALARRDQQHFALLEPRQVLLRECPIGNCRAAARKPGASRRKSQAPTSPHGYCAARGAL